MLDVLNFFIFLRRYCSANGALNTVGFLLLPSKISAMLERSVDKISQHLRLGYFGIVSLQVVRCAIVRAGVNTGRCKFEQ